MTNETTKEITKAPNPFEITTFAEAERYAKILADSDFAPKDYRGKPGNVLIAMQFGHEVGLKPMQAIQNIAVVNGRPMIYGDAALALVIGKKDCEYVRETMEGTIKGGDAKATCIVKRGKEIIERSFSIAQATQADLVGKAGPWKQYPERMLQLRARGFALRDSFPDALKGLYIEGEIIEGEYEVIKEDKSQLGINAVVDAIKTEKPINNEAVVDVNPETGEVMPPEETNAPTFDEVKQLMENANTVDQLIQASDLARSLAITAEKRNELAKIYKQKQLTIKSA